MTEESELVVVGAGAAGLMAAIWAGRSGRPALVLDGARTLGAKFLVSGGGRCRALLPAVEALSTWAETWLTDLPNTGHERHVAAVEAVEAQAS